MLLQTLAALALASTGLAVIDEKCNLPYTPGHTYQKDGFRIQSGMSSDELCMSTWYHAQAGNPIFIGQCDVGGPGRSASRWRFDPPLDIVGSSGGDQVRIQLVDADSDAYCLNLDNNYGTPTLDRCNNCTTHQMWRLTEIGPTDHPGIKAGRSWIKIEKTTQSLLRTSGGWSNNITAISNKDTIGHDSFWYVANYHD